MTVTNLPQILFPFWPFAREVVCKRCCKPVQVEGAEVIKTRYGVLLGHAHPDGSCPT